MNIKQYIVAMIAMLAFSINAAASEYNHSVPAVQGYDVVSYQTAKRPVRGNGHFISTYQGATYQFSSKANLALFKKDPAKYAPAYGGFCAFGVSVGKKFVGDPEVWRVVDGKLYLNLDTSIQSEWLKDVPGRIETANTEWTKIKDKSPASL
ncbi:MAG: YHS domain-containing (seleno)protein [Cellvibrionaceae bacterium]